MFASFQLAVSGIWYAKIKQVMVIKQELKWCGKYAHEFIFLLIFLLNLWKFSCLIHDDYFPA